MGIHGGTMPVSLLVSRDGHSLFSFVGRTGDDFLEALRQAHKPLPTFGNSTRLAPPRAPAGLFAGNSTESAPVFSLPGAARLMEDSCRHLQPFGLSDAPSSIEGRVLKPNPAPEARPLRIFGLRDYFQPRRGKTPG